MLYSKFVTLYLFSSIIIGNSFKTPFNRVGSQLVMRASKKTMRYIDNDYILNNERPTSPLYSPRGTNQNQYSKFLNDPSNSILLGVGPAGTGKTLFACATAVQELRKGNVNKIILTRPVVPVEEDIGYLPGSLINKMHPWTRPLFDILEEYYNHRDVESMLNSGTIEISPLAFMRGRTFKKCFIIADEMQNSSPNQMLMMTTRLGEGSRMVITGDLKQSDRCENNGLLDLLQHIKRYDKSMDVIKIVEFNENDIQRSSTVSKILDIYSNNKNQGSFNDESIGPSGEGA
jgi:phosphate starvation-inducible PhoH-like protein